MYQMQPPPPKPQPEGCIAFVLRSMWIVFVGSLGLGFIYFLIALLGNRMPLGSGTAVLLSQLAIKLLSFSVIVM